MILLIAFALASVAHAEERLSTAQAQAQVVADTGMVRLDPGWHGRQMS